MIAEHLTVGPFQTNVYVVGCPDTRAGAIVDAGGDAPGLLALAASHDLTLTHILQTHAHVDHVGALAEVRAQLDAPIYLHPLEFPLYDAAPQQGMMFGIPIAPLPPVDHELAHDQIVSVGDLRARVILAPGHSPGSVMFHFEEQGVLLGGDVLFQGSIGRVDLPGSDPQAMRRSLAAIKDLPPATRVLPGHGPETTIARELATNPFLLQDW